LSFQRRWRLRCDRIWEARERALEGRFDGLAAGDPDQPIEPHPQDAPLAMVAVELLGVGISDFDLVSAPTAVTLRTARKGAVEAERNRRPVSPLHLNSGKMSYSGRKELEHCSGS